MADHFLWEVGERWKNLSLELRCVGSMLEEVIAHWRRFDSLFPALDTWVNLSLPIAAGTEEQRINHFQVNRIRLLRILSNTLSS